MAKTNERTKPQHYLQVGKARPISRLTVSEAARELTDRLGKVVTPKRVTDLFYQRAIDEVHGPILGGRRLIPVRSLHAIARVLGGRGHLQQPVGPQPRRSVAAPAMFPVTAINAATTPSPEEE